MNELQELVGEHLEKIARAWKLLDLDTYSKKIAEIEQEMSQQDFWYDQDYAKQRSQEVSDLKNQLEAWESLRKSFSDNQDLMQELSDGGIENSDLLQEIDQSIKASVTQYNKLELSILLNDKYDKKDA